MHRLSYCKGEQKLSFTRATLRFCLFSIVWSYRHATRQAVGFLIELTTLRCLSLSLSLRRGSSVSVSDLQEHSQSQKAWYTTGSLTAYISISMLEIVQCIARMKPRSLDVLCRPPETNHTTNLGNNLFSERRLPRRPTHTSKPNRSQPICSLPLSA
jgi:hypothetical protein